MIRCSSAGNVLAPWAKSLRCSNEVRYDNVSELVCQSKVNEREICGAAHLEVLLRDAGFNDMTLQGSSFCASGNPQGNRTLSEESKYLNVQTEYATDLLDATTEDYDDRLDAQIHTPVMM